MKYPSLSIVIAAYNSGRIIGDCLESVKNQTYPKSKIEIIVSDGGSKDQTLKIAKSYGAGIIQVKGSQGAEINRARGVKQAKNELLLLIDHDNILPYKSWLQDMVEPLLKDSQIVAVETLRYHYDPKSTLLDRYFSLLGISDPLPYYLGKADRSSYASAVYEGPGKVIDCGTYYQVEFDSNKIPTLGANGFIIRRKLLMQHAKTDPEHFFHIDVNVDLIRKGFRRYAFVKNSIIHQTHHMDFWHYLKRRKLFMEKYYFTDFSKRRYSVYEKKDAARLIYFIIISLTIIKPLYDSVKGYLKVRDPAWFLHPLMCFGMVVVYGYTIFKWQTDRFLKQFKTIFGKKRVWI
ncbi:hypothetical protein A3J20_01345 [Candidatus Gottesmanbacteria bacterium RIFCSPLOWO2_02_FULL_42_29]|uniref:Glycosyltransferase 2-like domain-containing protein n=1 Tax=Candidatus Gottesmanbacteria bacterium RIFCSPLOWO2_01_FULL_42_22 TaxID=1798391 RepID=A0A1F6BCR0_9BACT|nr:MAG: hypothetical protein A2781_06070 [Candidatus Gottesmanbacteria bacterium RIFCSPHIGHO2_01_FULL_42_27]OGG22006.1 MAG: hypothetical protein A3E72_00830 [Candidatus Gottesmanbacteria bacterium RIFCSPHIGHO2_12_FULL_43_26]OGG34715.1 MAG: hypothetical protein A2968_02900 [Candidatus Gottesmanbacteria bacterium RIFCSPLOWO2_01_FULL_42_22]OGG39225.1 MAG: hypothetical protein A3J20_01345 [Candidatus Gottesmanbacteria bacterium RIFCSPLOWO2_02_FULL_42_29]